MLPDHQPHQLGPNVSLPEFPFSFPLEENFDVNLALHLVNLTFPFCVGVVIAYLMVIFAGQEFMSNRPAYKLTVPLFVWNMFLTLGTLYGLTRAYIEMYFVLSHLGFKHSVCGVAVGKHFNAMGFWGVAFLVSKMLELGDTLFVVLRKQPLIFLHWYHHITVLLLGWYSAGELNTTMRWLGLMNGTIHVAMYSHFALRTIKVHIPRWVTMSLTALQTSQMVVGLFINVMAYRYIQSGEACHVSLRFIWMSFLIAFSYLLLFSHYFYDSYITNTPMLKNIKLRRKEE